MKMIYNGLTFFAVYPTTAETKREVFARRGSQKHETKQNLYFNVHVSREIIQHVHSLFHNSLRGIDYGQTTGRLNFLFHDA